MQEAVENRRWHLVDLTQHPHMVGNLPVGIQQDADGQLVPAGFEQHRDSEKDKGQTYSRCHDLDMFLVRIL